MEKSIETAQDDRRMSQQQFNARLGESLERKHTIGSDVDPLDASRAHAAAQHTGQQKLEPVMSETDEAAPQTRDVYSEDAQSQYTLESDSQGHQFEPVQLTQEHKQQGAATESGASGAPPTGAALERRSSLASAKEAVQNFNKKKPLLMVLSVYLQIFLVFLSFLAIYWGSFYNRFERMANLKYLVVVEDAPVEGIPPYFGAALNKTLAALPQYGDWVIYSAEGFAKFTAAHDNTVQQEFYRQIHHQMYWGGIHVAANASYDLYRAMVDLDTAFVDSAVVETVYETGRDPVGMMAFIEPNIKAAANAFVGSASELVFQPMLAHNLTAAQQTSLIANASQIITSKSFMTSVDNRPVTSAAAIGPSLMGLVYCLVLSFHQFNFAARIHAELIVKLKHTDFIWFRLVSSQITFVFLSLLYCLMTIAFQVPVSTTFGRSGFLVLWATIFLNFSALGGITENVAIFIVARNRVYIGFWIVFFIVSNVAPTFYPIATCPDFYRYGYALPMHAAHEILNVIFFDTWKGNLGRDYAVLVAWIALTNIALPFSIKAGQKHVAKVAQRHLEKDKKDK